MVSRVMYEVDCRSLGIAGCSIGFSGGSPTEVVQRCVWHLKAEHDLELPDADDILAGRVDGIEDNDVRIIVDKLWQSLQADVAAEVGHY